MSRKKNDGDKSTDISKYDGKEVGDSDSGESGVVEIKESYVEILNQLGVDTRAMSLEEIRAEIEKRKGNLEAGNVYDLKTGKRVKSESKAKKKKGRTYQVKSVEGVLTAEEFDAARSEQDYKKRSDKEDKPVPTTPFVPPKPKP